MANTTKKAFLLSELPLLLEKLQPGASPSFGVMTPQHMIEHLTWIIKSSVKDHGEAPAEPTKGHLGFKKFIENGAVFKHYPKGKTAADLPPLKYTTFEEAAEQLPLAINRFYQYFEANPMVKKYHPMLGQLDFEAIELFHFQHCRYHFWQFGLLETYA